MIEKTNPYLQTADNLWAIPDDGNRFELVEGNLRMMSPAGSEHGRVAMRIASRLARHVEAKAEQWILAGTKTVLIADPANQTLGVCADISQIRVLRAGQTFDAGDACGGWKLEVDDAFQFTK